MLKNGFINLLTIWTENERIEAIKQLTTELPNAFECGADAVGFLSGPDVHPSRREEAKKQLEKSINEMAQVTRKYGPIGFLMESMDREVHKKHIIGPTTEAVDFILQLRETVPEFYFNLDAAHIKLLEEDPLDALSTALGVMSQIHLSNCVNDPTSPLFGDNHMPFGAPGFLTCDFIAKLFKKALDVNFLGSSKPIVSSEVLCKEGEDPWVHEKNCRETIIKACEKIEGSV